MKTFLTFHENSYGYSFGVMKPVADLNAKNNPRIPRKKGQPAGSDKHSDLYTDENPKGTIHGLGFKDVKTQEKIYVSLEDIRDDN